MYKKIEFTHNALNNYINKIYSVFICHASASDWKHNIARKEKPF